MKHSVIFCICFCFLQYSFAQTNSENAKTKKSGVSLDVKREKKSKLSTEITAGANWQTGNTEIIRISASANAAIIDSVKEFSFNMRYIYGENKKKKNQNEFSTGLQFDYRPLNRFSPFVRAELYSNEFKKISYRFSGLAGAKYRYFIKKKSNETVCDYSISGAVVYEYERYTREAGIQPKERFRLSVRPKFKQRLWKNTVFALECYYKPNIIDFSDCIVLSIVQLNFKLNKYLFVRCSYEWEYNNKPAAKALKKTDTLLMFNLGVNF